MNAPIIATTQAEKLERLIITAQAARVAAAKRDLFASREGHALTLAAHDLFEVDGLFDLAGDVAREIEPEDGAMPCLRTARAASLRPTPLRGSASGIPIAGEI